MTLEECLREAGGFPFTAKAQATTVEAIAMHRGVWFLRNGGSYVICSEDDSDEWTLVREPLKWSTDQWTQRSHFPNDICEAMSQGKRFKVTLEEIVED